MGCSGGSVSLVAISMVFVLSSMVMATDHIVGDDKGWTTNYDYVQWANNRVFHVGDNLVFNYDNSKHNVLKVNGTVFQQCLVEGANGTLSTGKDVVHLATSGRKWYICGFGNHCKDLGMKLAITVETQGPTAAPPSPTSPATSLPPFSSAYCFAYALLALIASMFFV